MNSDGCLVVYKPAGLSSHDVVAMVRRAYGVKAGHGGTLDPMAQGVLLIFMDKSLKVLPYIPPAFLDKTYLMRVTLGRATDTYDATGQVTYEHPGPVTVDRDTILASLRKFVGTYDQKPPVYSAIKVQGKRAYALARAGETVELASRKVHVTSIRLVRDYESGGSRHLVLRIHCSRGTYVRSVAHDLGQALGCGGNLSYLLRERVGSWTHLQAFPAWKIEQKLPFEACPAFMPYSAILPFGRATVHPSVESRVKSGSPLEAKDLLEVKPGHADDSQGTFIQIVSGTGELLALYGPPAANKPNIGQKLMPVRVFA
ncbi:MAG TPA: tRNA pseudouridine(55) synthase TruB [Candidatus Ozemobacteraceae bacterium]|nr:tRNA pseudouridine(55) synthase TruB [Candidatus Ozemobacteraceae bacterium]